MSYRSPWPNSAHPLRLLSDKRIEHYLLRGFYGRAAQQEAIANAAARPKKRERRTRATPSPKHDISDLY